MEGHYVQFGCGPCAPDNWQNFDAGPAFWLQSRFPFLKSMLVKRGFPSYPKNIRYGDVIKGLPVPEKSARAIYCSHVLEHLSLNELRTTIRNVHKYLQPGGVFRLVLPDIEYIAKSYVNESDPGASVRFMRESLLGEEGSTRGLKALPAAMFGRFKHLWMWDYKGMAAELAAAGFTRIRRAQLGDSGDAHFNDVEELDRWKNCLGVQCQRP
jgi:hypothetical protein